MIHFEIPKNQSSILKVIGVGGGGSNAVNYMHSLGIEGVDFIVCNTDSQALTLSSVANKIQLGPHLTQGLGAGANPEIGKQSCEESMEDVSKILKVNTRMAFITAGMGGGTGTGGAPVVARICRELGILTVGIVTTPFTYEGRKRMKQAQEGIEKMREHVDTILIISNDKLRQQFGNLPFTQAFAKADDILATAAKCITDVITSTGQINVDFADVCTVMKNGGVAILGSATVAGENRALLAVESALNSPLLNDSDIRGAKWILLNITSSAGEFEHTMDEAEAIQAYVQQQAGDNCDVILGMGHDPNLKEKISVTVIATGFNHKAINVESPMKINEPKKIKVELDSISSVSEVFNNQPEVKPTITRQHTMSPTLVELPEMNMNLNIFGVTPLTESTANDNKGIFTTAWDQKPAAEPEKPNGFLKEDNPSEERVQMQLVMKTEEPSGDIFGEAFAIMGAEQPKEPVREPVKEQPKEIVFREPVREQPKEVFREPAKEPAKEQPKEAKPFRETAWEPARDNAARRGERMLTDDELEEKRRFEEQKKALEDRAERLRRMSFNIRNSESADEIESVPAFQRKNMKLDSQNPSSDNYYSAYTVGPDGQKNSQGVIQTINTFLDGKKPD